MDLSPKQARLTLGLTQEEMAAACKANIGTITKWDQGQRSPRGPSERLLELWLELKKDGLFEKYLERFPK